MEPSSPSGRTVGVLLLTQLAGLIVPFVMLLPLTPAGFLETAAASSVQLKAAIALLLLNGALTIGISLVLWPLLRRYSEAGALLLIVASASMFILQAVDNAHLLSMLSLSQQYAQDGGHGEFLAATAAAVRSTRRWVHYATLCCIDAWLMALYVVLYRFALVPRALALFGAATVVLHFTGMILPFYLGYPGVTVMGASMAVSQLALVIWLMTKGFRSTRTVAPLSPAGA